MSIQKPSITARIAPIVRYSPNAVGANQNCGLEQIFLQMLLRRGAKKKYNIIYYHAFRKFMLSLCNYLNLFVTTKNFFNYNFLANYSFFLKHFIATKTLLYRYDKNPKNAKQEIKYISEKKRTSFFFKKMFLSLNTLTMHRNIINKLANLLYIHETNYGASYAAIYKKHVYTQLLKAKKKKKDII